MPKRILNGVVKSAKNKNTVIVKVERRFRHPLYQKTVIQSSSYAAHFTEGEYREGDVVKIIESRPISKTKKWTVLQNSL